MATHHGIPGLQAAGVLSAIAGVSISDLQVDSFNPQIGLRTPLPPQFQPQEVDQAMRRPKCRFPVRYEEHVNALLPHLNVMRNLASVVGQRLQVFQAMWLREMQRFVETRSS